MVGSALDFPASPSGGDEYTKGTTTWTYDSAKGYWKVIANGVIGPTGYTGSRGLQGYTGSQGLQGYTGSQGLQGYTGSQGITGFTGSSGGISTGKAIAMAIVFG